MSDRMIGQVVSHYRILSKAGGGGMGVVSLGPYLGWTQRWLKVPSTIVGSVGLSLTPISEISAKEVETEVGLAFAGGIVFAIVKQFQVGVIVGVDRLGGSAADTFAYQNKPW